MTTSKSRAAAKKPHKPVRPAAKAKAERSDKERAAKVAKPVSSREARAQDKKHAKPARPVARAEKPADKPAAGKLAGKPDRKGARSDEVDAKTKAAEGKPEGARRAEREAQPEAKRLKKGGRPVEKDKDAEGEEPEVAAAAAADDDDDETDPELAERTEVKALMERGRDKGFLTYDEVNDALPADIVSSEQIDDVMSMFGDHDIEVVDDAKKMKLPDKPPEQPEVKEEEQEEKEEEDPGYGKSNDPVRMYLRKMGSVSLLTREGEVEIAKRIEEGEKEVLASVLASSIAIKEILDLGERLKKGKIRVREIIKDAGDETSAEEVEEVEDVEVEVAGPAPVEGAEGPVVVVALVEGAEAPLPKLARDEEKKVEHVLKHIDRIRKLEQDVVRIKETLASKKMSEVKRKELKADIKTVEMEMV
ncbi:MAG TPA: RNA polymerase sigma factor region1.1 domain-containing protein, partial [Anaeromyxobacteraceae bacterium]